MRVRYIRRWLIIYLSLMKCSQLHGKKQVSIGRIVDTIVMDTKVLTLLCMISCWSSTTGYHTFYNPYVKVLRYNNPYYYTGSHSNYVNHVPLPSYNPYFPSYSPQPLYEPEPQTAPYHSHLNRLPTINILAAKPYMIEKTFTVVPMLVVPEDNLNMITNGQVTSVSKKKPLVTLKTNNKDTIQCTPAVKIALDAPMTVYSLKTSIMFPSQMAILHENTRIPIRIGAVIVPVAQDTFVSEETPITVTEVYAIPTKPMQIDVDYVNNDRDVVINANAESVIVENNEGTTPGVEDDDDSELVNRNPPSAPAGIVQSTQPGQTHLEVFQNPKESPVLIALREESKKRI